MLHYPQTRSNLLEALSHTFSGLGEEGTGGEGGAGSLPVRAALHKLQ